MIKFIPHVLMPFDKLIFIVFSLHVTKFLFCVYIRFYFLRLPTTLHVLLAHLSRRLTGELIGKVGLRRPSSSSVVHTF